MADKKDLTLEDILKEYSTKNSATQSVAKPVENKPAAQSVTQPVSKPVAQPASKPVAQPASKPVAQPVSKPVAQPVSKPVAQPVSKPVAQPVSKPVAQPASQPVAQPASKSVTQPASKSVTQPVSKPVAQPVSKPVAQPASKPVAQPASKPVTQPENKPVNSPAANQSEKKPVGRVDNNSPFKMRLEQYKFLFKQLVQRDFKGRYKKAVLGVLWSMLSPMLTFAAQAVVFTFLLARNQEHFISYLVIGNVVFHYFTDAANAGMFSMVANGSIISKIKVPKSIFLFSKNVSCLFNFGLTMIIMFIICAIDGVHFSLHYFAIIYPVLMLTIFNLGVGYLLSAWFVFFKDTQYLFGLFTQILMYFSAIFYDTTRFPEELRSVFYVNPIYCYISYMRTVIIYNTIPDFKLHLLCAFYAVIVILFGIAVYKKNSNKFVYYF